MAVLAFAALPGFGCNSLDQPDLPATWSSTSPTKLKLTSNQPGFEGTTDRDVDMKLEFTNQRQEEGRWKADVRFELVDGGSAPVSYVTCKGQATRTSTDEIDILSPACEPLASDGSKTEVCKYITTHVSLRKSADDYTAGPFKMQKDGDLKARCGFNDDIVQFEFTGASNLRKSVGGGPAPTGGDKPKAP